MAATTLSYFSTPIKRLSALARQAFNNGVGYFFVSTISAVAAIAFGRIAYDQYRFHSERLAWQLNCLGAETEPRREDRYAGVSSLLLGPINLDWVSEYDHVRALPGYEQATEVRAIVQQLARGISEPRKPGPDAATRDRLLTDLRQDCPALAHVLGEHGSVWDAYSAAVIDSVVTDRVPGRIRRPRPESRARRSRPDRSLRIDPLHPHESALLVPAIYGDDAEAAIKTPEAKAPKLSETSRRLRNAVRYSRLLDVAVLPLEFQSDSSAGQPCFQAYFISPDHVLRFWHQGRRSGEMVGRFGDLRYWAAPKYAERLVASADSAYVSRAYFDYAEGGVTLTESAPIVLADSTLVGILATDLRVPTEVFIGHVAQRTLLFDVRRVRVSRDRLSLDHAAEVRRPSTGTLPEYIQHFFSRAVADSVRWIDVDPDRKAEALAAVASAASQPDFGREIQNISVGRHHAFVVPIGDLEQDRIDALVLIPHPPSLPFSLLLCGGMSILSTGVALGLFFVGFLYSHRNQELEGRRAVLRGLQVGLVRLSGEGEILEANDRAEELLRARLPKLGGAKTRSEERCKFGDFLHNEIWLKKERPDGREGDLKRELFSEEIKPHRRRGRRSTYYVQRRGDSPLWLRILGSPMLGVGEHGGDLEIFVAFDRVTNEEMNGLKTLLTRTTGTEPPLGNA